MRDDRRPSHDPARGGIIGGGPLIARRPAHRSSGGHSMGGDNPVQSMSGEQNLKLIIENMGMNSRFFNIQYHYQNNH